MAVRNTKTGGARKRVAGEVKKGATKTTKKPSLLSSRAVEMLKQHESARPKSSPKKPTNTISSEPTKKKVNPNGPKKDEPTKPYGKPTTPTSSIATKKKPNMNDQYRPTPKTPTSKEPATKPAVKKPDLTKKRTGQIDEMSQSQFKKKRPTGSN